MKKLNSKLIGDAGEYYVAGELTRRGYVVTFTSPNTKNIDLIVTNEDSKKIKNLQVKTTSNNTNIWLLKDSHEDIKHVNLYYIFVRLSKEEDYKPVSFHVVPSRSVSIIIRREQERIKKQRRLENKLRSKKKKKRVKPVTNTLRSFTDYDNKYKDKWEKLNLD